MAISKWCCKNSYVTNVCWLKLDELLLRVDISEQGEDEGKDMVYKTNMGQINNGEGGEEILATDVQCFDAKLQRVCEDDDFEVEE
jgi:hypothetical protein